MSVASDLITALTDTGLSITQNIYTGTNETYIIFNYTTIPDLFASNEPLEERYLIQVHLIALATTNTTAYQKQIKTLLFAAEYDYPSTVQASDDEAEQHIVFETETVVAV